MQIQSITLYPSRRDMLLEKSTLKVSAALSITFFVIMYFVHWSGLSTIPDVMFLQWVYVLFAFLSSVLFGIAQLVHHNDFCRGEFHYTEVLPFIVYPVLNIIALLLLLFLLIFNHITWIDVQIVYLPLWSAINLFYGWHLSNERADYKNA